MEKTPNTRLFQKDDQKKPSNSIRRQKEGDGAEVQMLTLKLGLSISRPGAVE